MLTDLAIVVACTAAMLVEGLTSPEATLTPLGVVLMVLAPLPVLVRRQHPLAAMAAATVLMSAVIIVAVTYQSAPVASMVVGYTVASMKPRRTALVVGGLVALVVLGLVGMHHDKLLSVETPVNLALVALPLTAGMVTRERRRAEAALRERVERAEATREQEAQRRADEERLRIARDVHDVVAHAMTSISVQAGVGARLIDRDVAQARTALTDIREISTRALADLRATLGVLRSGSGTGSGPVLWSGAAPVAPTPGLADLPELAARMRTAGVEVTLDGLEGSCDLPAALDATGYRVVQEALTNVLRHAGATTARVRVRRTDGLLVVEVDDDGAAGDGAGPRTAAGEGSGNGLVGMRERVGALGGRLEAGARGAGWRVRAELPVEVVA